MKTIDKSILLAAKIAAKTRDNNNILSNVQIKSNEIIATESHYLLKIKKWNGFDVEEFPTFDKTPLHSNIPEKGILINAKDILKKLKFEKSQTLPILETAVILNKEKTAEFLTTDLETNTKIELKKSEGIYPDVTKVFPDKDSEHKTITFFADFLIELLQAFKGGNVSFKVFDRCILIEDDNESKEGLLVVKS